MSQDLYFGHSIFRNQPSYTHFNKSYVDRWDTLYLDLNAIDQRFFNCSNRIKTGVLIDPRSGKAVTCTEYDHSCKLSLKKLQTQFLLKSEPSNLGQHIHVVGLRILKAQQDADDGLDEVDLLVWRKFESAIRKEQKRAQNYIREHVQQNKEAFAEHFKPLVMLYKSWYAQQVVLLLQNGLQNLAFNTYMGLPAVHYYKEQKPMAIANIELLACKGKAAWWQDSKGLDCSKLQNNLPKYSQIYNNSMQFRQQFMQQEIQQALQQQHEDVLFYMSLDSLLFLLGTGDYLDLPNEMLFKLEIEPDSDRKLFKFDNPLPSRVCGWHTNNMMIEQAFQAFACLPGRFKWFELNAQQAKLLADSSVQELQAGYCEGRAFKPQTYEEFMQQQAHVKQAAEQNVINFNESLIKWSLVDAQQDFELHFLTNLSLAAFANNTASKLVAAHIFKVENKPQFGCEQFTKYELIRLWLQFKLNSCHTGVSSFAACSRLSGQHLETMLHQRMHRLDDIELQLLENYKVNMPQMLSNLGQFLQLLLNLPAGQYMLRHNASFKDKLLLCTPSQEITQNTVHLHQLIKTEPSDLKFLTSEQPYLAISESLVSVLHAHHRVMPCTFKPQRKQEARQQQNCDKPFINDRALRLELKRQSVQEYRQRVKRYNKKRRAKAKKAANALQNNDSVSKEIEQDMASDKLLFDSCSTENVGIQNIKNKTLMGQQQQKADDNCKALVEQQEIADDAKQTLFKWDSYLEEGFRGFESDDDGMS